MFWNVGKHSNIKNVYKNKHNSDGASALLRRGRAYNLNLRKWKREGERASETERPKDGK